MNELDFIYNEGSYAHRGVWHVTDNLEVKHFEASDITEHGYGSRLERTITPAYEVAKGDAICGQVDGMQTGSAVYSNLMYQSPDGSTHRAPSGPDDILLIRRRAHRANYQRGLDNPPGPLCSRCEKKAGLV